MKILVITSCGSKKKYKCSKQLTREDFVSPELLHRRTKELKDYKTPAAEMYTGPQHQCLMAGLKEIREVHGPTVVDLHIVSAGYGLLCEDNVIVPYNVTFGKRREIRGLSDNLQIHECVETLIAGYDLVFFLLGEKYVRALQLPFVVPDTVTQIFLAAPSWKSVFSDFLPDIHVVCAGTDLAKQLDGATNYNLKGFVFKQLCRVVLREGLQVFEKVRQAPQEILNIVLANRQEGYDERGSF